MGANDANSLQYAGRENDNTGLYFYRARYYDPQLKRFITQDPLGLVVGINGYRYARDNAVRFADPTGLWAFGFSGEISTINPFTSGGGGTYGLNLEYTSSDGWHLYDFYTPPDVNSGGFQLGASGQVNIATGTGPWTGLFESASGSYGYFTGGYFQTPPNDPSGPGYAGISFGGSFGPPGIGLTKTCYKRVFPDSPSSPSK